MGVMSSQAKLQAGAFAGPNEKEEVES